MIEVRELGDVEIKELISQLNYGHLGCTEGMEPYVVPIHYSFEPPYVYVYTTEGKKSEILARNPRVCLQIEDITDNRNWKSVIIQGEAERLLDEDQRSAALKDILKVNPTLTPAVSVHWRDNWVRENIEVIYRIVPLEMSGRASVAKSETHTPFVRQKRIES